jgi:virginiamycin B lyase
MAYGTNPIEIASTGHDLWFNSIQFQGRIARVTPSGSITEFPTVGDSPDHLAAGPDGNAWFTDSANRKVGYVTPTGAVTTFPVALSGAVEFSGMVAGSDGAMWFTVGGGPEFGLGVLGRVTIGGDVTLRPLGDMTLTGLTRAPDGSLWVPDLRRCTAWAPTEVSPHSQHRAGGG